MIQEIQLAAVDPPHQRYGTESCMMEGVEWALLPPTAGGRPFFTHRTTASSPDMHLISVLNAYDAVWRKRSSPWCYDTQLHYRRRYIEVFQCAAHPQLEGVWHKDWEFALPEATRVCHSITDYAFPDEAKLEETRNVMCAHAAALVLHRFTQTTT